MALNEVIAQIDAEIARLQQAKSLLEGPGPSLLLPTVRRGRPKKDAETVVPAVRVKKKRKLSPEGRARIAEAVKRRWATQKSKQKDKE